MVVDCRHFEIREALESDEVPFPYLLILLKPFYPIFSHMAQPSTLNEISQLILNKERELHQFHDLRCGQLEALVEERDQLLIESSRRFEKLKDDFEYNLSLIQARDSEMERLDHELRKCHDELEACRTERRNLTLQLEASRTRESDAAKKSELDRLNNKVMRCFVYF